MNILTEYLIKLVSLLVLFASKLRNFLPRPSPLQIYKCFVRLHLDYGDIIYDKAFIGSFQKKLESIQYNTALAITGTIRGTSREKVYSELGLESSQDRRWYKKLYVFYRILNNMLPKYLSDIIPSTTRRHSSRNASSIPLESVNNNYFINSFFPSTVTECNKLDLSIHNSTSLHIFKGRLLQFVRRLENSVFTCHNPIGIKYLTRLRLGFSHVRYHKFNHGFLDAVDPLCSCSTAIENTVHYLLHCSNFSTARNTFLNEIAIVDRSIIDQDEIKIIQTFLYRNPTYPVSDNKLILDASIKYILETKRSDGPIF